MTYVLTIKTPTALLDVQLGTVLHRRPDTQFASSSDPAALRAASNNA